MTCGVICLFFLILFVYSDKEFDEILCGSTWQEKGAQVVMAEYHVTEQDQGMRIDQFLCKCQPDVSRSAIQKWIKDGNVLVQGKPARQIIASTREIRSLYLVPEPVEVSIQPQDIPLDIII